MISSSDGRCGMIPPVRIDVTTKKPSLQSTLVLLHRDGSIESRFHPVSVEVSTALYFLRRLTLAKGGPSRCHYGSILPYLVIEVSSRVPSGVIDWRL